MFISNKSLKFSLNSVKILIIFVLFLNFTNSLNEYQIGYRNGLRDGFIDGKRETYRQRNHFRRRPQHIQESQPFDSYDINERRGLRPRQGKDGSAVNYGNIFAIDGNTLSKGFAAMTGGCQQLIMPEFGACIERAANKFDVNVENETLLGENDCKALWELMCCSTDLISRKCTAIDLKTVNLGFVGIQKMLEIKGCANSLRKTVKCSDTTEKETKNLLQKRNEKDLYKSK